MRERLMSGQRWYFDEDGFDITIDLVVDVWDGPLEKSNVMIGGLWYTEDAVQKMVRGRENSHYKVDGEVSYDRLCRNLDIVKKTVEDEMRKYQPFELEHVVKKIADSVVQRLVRDPYGNAVPVAEGGVMIDDDVIVYVNSVVQSCVRLKKVTVW